MASIHTPQNYFLSHLISFFCTTACYSARLAYFINALRKTLSQCNLLMTSVMKWINLCYEKWYSKPPFIALSQESIFFYHFIAMQCWNDLKFIDSANGYCIVTLWNNFQLKCFTKKIIMNHGKFPHHKIPNKSASSISFFFFEKCLHSSAEKERNYSKATC